MAAGYDAASALAEFHETRAGVRGLVESGVTTVPPIFLMPAATSSSDPSSSTTTAASPLSIPVVDLSLPRSDTVELVRAAATSLGFFHVTNHGVRAAAVAAVRDFHEQPAAARSAFYSATAPPGRAYYSTIRYPPPQHGQPAALPLMPWRDSLIVPFFDGGEPDNLPAVCRDALLEYHRSLTTTTGFGKEMTALLSEALGLPAERLEQALPVEGSVMVCHYYPACPEPLRVVGTRDHTDHTVFTVLAQDDHVGGLQVRLDQGGGDGEWVDVAPVTGALLVNIGDVLQVVSNDEYKSVEHRVVLKSPQHVRVSVALFFQPAKCGESDFFGPLPELVTEGRPAHYRALTFPQLANYKRELGHARSSLDRFKI
ncbi:hypothetical protein EJB05_09222, partial [Eragrostis curvula]